ncbi:hypothetical protein [Streptomyces sp. NPDC046759]
MEPYFIARCACEWIGAAHDAQVAGALAAAAAEAFDHGQLVAPMVVRVLD